MDYVAQLHGIQNVWKSKIVSEALNRYNVRDGLNAHDDLT